MVVEKGLHSKKEVSSEDEVLPEGALEAVDLSLPEDYELEVMAAELLGHLTAYVQSKAANRAARQAEQHDKAVQFAKQMEFSKVAAALIQHQYPGAKAIADKLASIRARQAAQARNQSAVATCREDTDASPKSQ